MAKKILLINNYGLTCRVLQQYLTRCGYEVVLAIEGEDDGLLLAATESPDLILIDMGWSVTDGWQAIKILKESTVTQKIPILALMEPSTQADWRRVFESSCDAYELKPVDLTSILKKITALLEPIPGLSNHTALSESNRQLSREHLTSMGLTGPELLQKKTGVVDVANPTDSRKSMVVYVDDNPLDSQAMAKIVGNVGYSYDNIAKPLEAIPLLLELRPKLIFLDLVMPFTNGYELCAQIRRISDFRRTPIIIVTNNDGIIDRVRAKLVGASGFFSKPVKEKRVLKILEKYLNPIYR